jgi:hypothetical protein
MEAAEFRDAIKGVRTQIVNALIEKVREITEKVYPEIYLRDHDASVVYQGIDDQMNETIDKIELHGENRDKLIFLVDDNFDGYRIEVDQVGTEMLLDILEGVENIEPYEEE